MIKKIFLVILDPLIYSILQLVIGFGVGILVGVSLAVTGMFGGMLDVGIGVRLVYGIVLLNALVMLFILILRDSKKPIVRKRWAIHEVGLKNSMLLLFVGFYGNVLCTCILFFLKSRFQVNGEVQENIAGRVLKDNIWIFALTIAVVVPIVEEWIFRMSIIERFKKGAKGKWTIILIQALIFGLFHMNFVQSTYTFILGILLGAAYFRFRSVVAPLLIHMGFNGTGILIGVLPRVEEQLADFSTLAMTIGIAAGVVLICIWMMKLFHGDLDTEVAGETLEWGDMETEPDIEQMEAAYWQMGKIQ